MFIILMNIHNILVFLIVLTTFLEALHLSPCPSLKALHPFPPFRFFSLPSKTSHQSSRVGRKRSNRSVHIRGKLVKTFIEEKFPPPIVHYFMQDNDPKHTSRDAQEFFWWKTPLESPDMNPLQRRIASQQRTC